MPTVRWNPLVTDLWNNLQMEANRLWDVLVKGPESPGFAYSYPPVNVWEDADNLYAEAELPGLQLDKVEILVKGGNELTLQGDRRPREEKGTWIHRERGFGKFSRTLTLPVAVDPDRVEARFEQGVLRLTLPKAEHARARRITVKGE